MITFNKENIMSIISNKRIIQTNPIKKNVQNRPRESWKQNIKEVLKKHQNKKDEGVILEFLDENLDNRE